RSFLAAARSDVPSRSCVPSHRPSRPPPPVPARCLSLPHDSRRSRPPLCPPAPSRPDRTDKPLPLFCSPFLTAFGDQYNRAPETPFCPWRVNMAHRNSPHGRRLFASKPPRAALNGDEGTPPHSERRLKAQCLCIARDRRERQVGDTQALYQLDLVFP